MPTYLKRCEMRKERLSPELETKICGNYVCNLDAIETLLHVVGIDVPIQISWTTIIKYFEILALRRRPQQRNFLWLTNHFWLRNQITSKINFLIFSFFLLHGEQFTNSGEEGEEEEFLFPGLRKALILSDDVTGHEPNIFNFMILIVVNMTLVFSFVKSTKKEWVRECEKVIKRERECVWERERGKREWFFDSWTFFGLGMDLFMSFAKTAAHFFKELGVTKIN